MKTGLVYILCLISLASLLLVQCQSKNDMNELKNQISQELNTQIGVFAVSFINLSNGTQFFINGDANFHAASTMKTPVMVEVFRQGEEREFSLQDSIMIKNDFISIVDGSHYSLDSSDDSDSEIYNHIGEKRTIYKLMYDMIIYSSNLSTNLIIDLVGAKNVNNNLDSMGVVGINVLRGVEDIKAYNKGLNNTTTANGLRKLFEEIARGKAIDSAASGEMIRILSDQKHNNIIPALLPDKVQVAHKTGSITGVHHDSGIIILPDGTRYVLVILSRNVADEEAATASMAKVSRMVYDWVVQKQKD